jgi:hypothetical protein
MQPGPMALKARATYFEWAEANWRILPKAA